MSLRDAIRLAISAMRGGVVRTLLTIIGLGVGVGAVLTVLTLGDAGEVRVEEEIAKLGVDKVWIRASDERHTLHVADAGEMQLASSAPACAGAYTLAQVYADNTAVLAQIAGYDGAMNQVHAPKLLRGRTFSSDDFAEGRCVCLIDEALAEYLGKNVLGSRLRVGNRRLRIVGVIKGMTMQTMSAGNGLVLMPLTTFTDTLGGEIAEITLSVQRGQKADQVAKAALRTLADEKGFRADTLEKEINAAREVVRIFVMVLACVAVVCVLTGGIGVMNVMLVSVRERRSEIGLIKAVGGTSAQVGGLFLIEAIAYAFLGGVLGLVLGVLMVRAFGGWIGLDAQIDFMLALPVLASAALLGVAFGVAPALKAAGMQPVDALKCE